MGTDWKDRLHQWTPEPPPAAWDRLSESLSEEISPALANKLQQFSPTPPPATWNNIATALDTATAPAPVVPMRSSKSWLRYAGAAAILLAAFLGVRQYSGETYTPAPVALDRKPAASPAEQPVQEPATPPEMMISGASVLPFKISKGNEAPPTALAVKGRRPAPVRRSQATTLSGNIYQLVPVARVPQVNDKLVERYIVLTNEEAGIRLPKKVYDLYRCDNDPDIIACTERLAALRRRAAAPSTLASADFAGLLEVIRKVETVQ